MKSNEMKMLYIYLGVQYGCIQVEDVHNYARVPRPPDQPHCCTLTPPTRTNASRVGQPYG